MYTVRVADNFHYRDESETYTLGTFATLAEAEAAAREVVDGFLRGQFKPGMTADALYRLYSGFGDEPFILPGPDDPLPPPPRFAGWEYARARCDALCAGSAAESG